MVLFLLILKFFYRLRFLLNYKDAVMIHCGMLASTNRLSEHPVATRKPRMRKERVMFMRLEELKGVAELLNLLGYEKLRVLLAVSHAENMPTCVYGYLEERVQKCLDCFGLNNVYLAYLTLRKYKLRPVPQFGWFRMETMCRVSKEEGPRYLLKANHHAEAVRLNILYLIVFLILQARFVARRGEGHGV
jgi:hypothetical protein